VNDPDRMPLAAFVVFSARKNAFPVVGGRFPMTVAFSSDNLTWSSTHGYGGDEGAVAWDEVSAISFRKGRTHFSPAEMAIVLRSGREIVFETSFPLTNWRALHRGLSSLGSTDLLELIGTYPNALLLLRFYPFAPWNMLVILSLMALAMNLWPSWWTLVCVSFGIIGFVEFLFVVFRRKRPFPYPRIIDRIEMTSAASST